MPDASSPDVVIVGAGISGAAAALQLARRGVGFVGVDRAPRFGGTARGGGVGSSIAGSPMQRDAGIADDWRRAVRDLEAEGNDPDPAWSRFYYRRSVKDVWGWYEALGVPFEKVVQHEGDSVARWHLPLGGGARVMGAAWKKLGALGLQDRWRFGLAVKDLLGEGGRISGIVVEDDKGERAEIRGKAVLLAAGGFGGNADMARDVSGRFRKVRRLLAGGNPNSQGELHAIVARHGGALAKMQDVYAYANGTPDYRDAGGRRGVVVRAFRSGIWVNAKGRRFHDESLHMTGRSAVDALLAQPGETCWAVFDDDALGELEIVDHYVGRDAETREATTRRYLESSPFFTTADTPETLAGSIGVPADALAASIGQWNGLISSGAAHDAQTGRALAGLRPLGSGGSWHAIQFFPLLRKTMGGVATDLKCRVVDAAGRPIPGLYAAGELTGMGGGGMAGWRPLEGLMAGGSLFTGLIAARWAHRDLARAAAAR